MTANRILTGDNLMISNQIQFFRHNKLSSLRRNCVSILSTESYVKVESECFVVIQYSSLPPVDKGRTYRCTDTDVHNMESDDLLMNLYK